MEQMSYSLSTKSSGVTGYHVPLSKRDLTLLGKLTAAWSQIDVLTAMASASLYGLPVESALFKATLDDTSGRRLSRFKKGMKLLNDGDLKDRCRKFCRDTFPLNDKRNHIMHGIWVSKMNWDTQRHVPACYHPHYGTLLHTEMPALYEKFALQSIVIRDIFLDLKGLPKPLPSDLPLFGISDGPAPR